MPHLQTEIMRRGLPTARFVIRLAVILTGLTAPRRTPQIISRNWSLRPHAQGPPLTRVWESGGPASPGRARATPPTSSSGLSPPSPPALRSPERTRWVSGLGASVPTGEERLVRRASPRGFRE